MIACLDVHYRETTAQAACVLLSDWAAVAPADVRLAQTTVTEAYVPGHLYARELDPLLKVLEGLDAAYHVVVVDGYVWLDKAGTPGLGAHLHRALGGKVPVVGVAKEPFGFGDFAHKVYRGASAKPLFVTTVGMTADTAAFQVCCMHGHNRIPTVLRLVDHLSRHPSINTGEARRVLLQTTPAAPPWAMALPR
jgi:deoxyribonuclease V